MIGRTLQHYEIIEKLGSGGMGEVFVALDTKLNRRVALKVLPSEMSGNVDRRRRFEREAQAVAALNHPNIVTLHSVEESDGVHFLTMELVEGETLSEAIPLHGMSLEKFFEVAVPLADALAAAHQKGVIHRDLKPANVMVNLDGVPKVLDFGLAKLAEPVHEGDEATQLPTTSVTQDGKIVGTFSYMSPEQAEGKPVDARSDVFSLGILLYEMSTGRRPFQGDTNLSVLSSILKDTPQSVSDVNPRQPRAVARVIQRCLSKDPAERFQSAQGLKAELASLKGESQSGELDEPVAAEPTPAPNVIVGAISISWVVVLVVAAVIVALVMFNRGGGEPESAPAGTAVVTPATPSTSVVAGKKRIAVLPLENLGPADDAYFAAGITEEITSRLAAASGLAVISRASTQSYDRSGKSMQEIGQDLGVDYVLDGTVRWQRAADGTSRVRVTPQLIEAATDTQLWSDRLDRSMEDLFGVQSEIATSVVEQLGVTLLSGERDAVEARPTDNLKAYQEYLRGKELVHELNSVADWSSGIRRLQRAVELDPEFALGWAELSVAHSQMHHYRQDLSQERLNLARAAADRSLSLQPQLPEARLALGYYYYWGHKDYEQALDQLSRISRDNDPKVLETVAYIRRRQGRFEEALTGLQTALQLDPRNAELVFETASTMALLRRYADADVLMRHAAELSPDNAAIHDALVRNRIQWDGDLAAARRLRDAAPATEDAQLDLRGIQLARMEGDYQEALDLLANTKATVFQAQESYWPPALLQGQILRIMGRSEEAQSACEKARAMVQGKVEEDGREHRYHAALGLIYACLDQREEAVGEARLGSDLYPVSRDRYAGPIFVENLALVFAQVGQTDAALDRLESLVTDQGETSWYAIAREPLWQSVWDEPRFQALEAELNYQATPSR